VEESSRLDPDGPDFVRISQSTEPEHRFMPGRSKTNVSRILIIDDNPAIHDDFRKILEGTPRDDLLDGLSAEIFGEPVPASRGPLNFEIESAYQGEEGLEILEEALSDNCPFSLAFVDMRMPPGWDGLDTIERLWEVDPDLLIVICTAFADHSWLEVAERLGNNDRWLVLKKPFDNAEVRQMATVYSEKRRLMNQMRELANQGDSRISELRTVLQ
jgi:CheY-like chemotaxis protein